MSQRYLDVKSVAVIGAGVSGVAAVIHLRKAGLDVTGYERSNRAGGVWVYDERVANDAAYPSMLPSVGDSPEGDERDDNEMEKGTNGVGDISSVDLNKALDVARNHAPPGPAYVGLKNNVSTVEMEMQSHAWNPGTEEFILHNFLADYIQDAARANDVEKSIQFNTRVQRVRKVDERWRVTTSKLVGKDAVTKTETSTKDFDAVVVATGHYHASKIPDIEGLAAWKKAFPERVYHSKLYREPDSGFRGQNVLLVGAGVSSLDIAKELGPVVKSIYQVSRGGMYDLPSFLLPENGMRIGPIRSFDACGNELNENDAITGTVTLDSGQRLCDIHRVILCTGYHVSFPFLKEYHADGRQAEDADDHVLVTDGQQTHNLHKDIFYIPDPTLTFIGVPYHTATFSLFEFQAIALASVLAGWAPLPSEADMRAEYQDRLQAKGAGRTFHSLKDSGAEIAYVKELVQMANKGRRGGPTMIGHSQRWLDAYERRKERIEALFSNGAGPSKREELSQGILSR